MDRTPFRPRRYLAKDFDPMSAEERRRVCNALWTELKAAKSGAALQTWLAHFGELDDAIDEEGAARRLDSELHTDDPARQKAYIDFLNVPDSRNTLLRQFLKNSALNQLPRAYDLFRQRTKNRLGLSRPKNNHRIIQQARLEEKYNEIRGSGVADSSTQRRRIAAIYDRLLALRHAMAQEAGFGNYLHYQFQKMGHDSTPRDSIHLHKEIERHVVPLLRRIVAAGNGKNLEVASPFKSGKALFNGVRKIVHRLDPGLAAQLDQMKERGMLDLNKRPGKIPGGFTFHFPETGLSFVFMNRGEDTSDISTLLHEGGHFFHDFAARSQPFFDFRETSRNDFLEIPSKSMELLGATRLKAIYPPEKAERARKNALLCGLETLAQMTAVDAFEHWAYTHPGHTHRERREAWKKQYDRFGGYEDYQQVPLLFTHPLYSIRYVTSEIGALQVWQNYLKDPQKTMEQYRHALSLGSSKPVPELCKAMGIQFDPRGDLLPGLMAVVEKELLRPVEKPTAAQMVPRLDFQRSTGRKSSGLAPQSHLTKT